jgi:hypothetical protein
MIGEGVSLGWGLPVVAVVAYKTGHKNVAVAAAWGGAWMWWGGQFVSNPRPTVGP